ncbi:MAG: hypothetical protein MH825_17020 [Cyanobacteria bacterium]|nr:hypothetical protein [Cyanobacteriota bacterium]
MSASGSRPLGPLALAAMLVASQYGLGFLLGTAEQAVQWGAAGSLYPVSLVVGMGLLLLLGRFYWREVEQIWTLLGDRYGDVLRRLVGLMSWLAFVGVAAAQVAAGAAILQTVALPWWLGAGGLALTFALLSLLPLERASVVIRGLLVTNAVVLLLVLTRLGGWGAYWRSPLDFSMGLSVFGGNGQGIGLAVASALAVSVDMKCHQFVVKARNLQSLYGGLAIAMVALWLLAFLPSTVALAAMQGGILPAEVPGAQAIPYLLAWAGGGLDHPLAWGAIAIAALPAIGLGSNVLRAQAKALMDLQLLPSTGRWRFGLALLNSALALVVAARGGAIVSTMTEFYTAYVVVVVVPFGLLLIERRFGIPLAPQAVTAAAIATAIGSLAALVTLQLHPQAAWCWSSPELTIALTGLAIAPIGLGVSRLLAHPSLPSQRMVSRWWRLLRLAQR